MNSPKVSVVVTVYNCEDYIRQCLDSILAQRCEFLFEIVIVEDCSTDASVNMLEEYVGEHPDIIKVVNNEKNKGVLYSFSRAVGLTRGEYVAFCDGDDFWQDPLKLAQQVDLLDQKPEYVLIYTETDVLHEGTGEEEAEIYKKKNYACPSGDVYECLMKKNFVSASTPCCRGDIVRAAVLKMDLKNRQEWMMQDYPVWLSLSLDGKFFYYDKSTSTNRVREESVSQSRQRAKRASFKYGVWRIREYFLSVRDVSPELRKKILADAGNRTIQYFFHNKKYSELREFANSGTLPVSSQRAKLISFFSRSGVGVRILSFLCCR